MFAARYLLIAVGWSCAGVETRSRRAPAPATVIERASPAIGPAGAVEQDVGIETLGGMFTPLLKRGCPTPCSTVETFSTASDNQAEIQLHFFRGDAQLVSAATDLGAYRIKGIPAQPRGIPQIEVTLATRGGDVVVSARDRSGTAYAVELVSAGAK